jgi:excinuclease UvrABC nuclease subunit
MKKNSIAHGPLARAEKRLEDFSFNLYFSFMFNESVEAHRKLEDQYLEAFLDQDYEQMQKIDREISYVESAFEATACMLDATKDGFS